MCLVGRVALKSEGRRLSGPETNRGQPEPPASLHPAPFNQDWRQAGPRACLRPLTPSPTISSAALWKFNPGLQVGPK